LSIKITPKGKFVHVILNKVEAGKTDGGIYLPDKHSEGTRLAKVLAKGPDVSPDVEIGSIWAVEWYAGTPVHFVSIGMLDDTNRLVSESELMARIDEVEDDIGNP
jgi:co-chaperonin GroES (HSP10)